MVIHIEIDQEGQANNTQQKTHPEDTDNDRAVPQGADDEMHWTSRQDTHRYKCN